jgi:hypothetical protein
MQPKEFPLLGETRLGQYSGEIFDEIIRYLNQGRENLRGRRIRRYFWRRSWEITWYQVDLEMMEGILGRGSIVLAYG